MIAVIQYVYTLTRMFSKATFFKKYFLFYFIFKPETLY